MSNPTPTCTPIGKPVTMPCPCCGEVEACISVHIFRLGDDSDDAFACAECNSEFSVATVRAFVAKWTTLLTWLDTVPTFPASE